MRTVKANVRRKARISSCLESLENRQMLAGDLIAHWRAESLVSTVADQAPIASWVDEVGGVAANASGQPVLAAGALNGRAVVRFNPSDGVDLVRVASTASPLRNAEDFSLVVAFSTDASTIPSNGAQWFNYAGLIDGNSLGFGTDWGMSLTGQGQIATGMGGGFTETPQTILSDVAGLNDGQLQVAIVTRSGGNLRLYIGDRLAAETSSANALPRSPLDFAIGATASGNLGFPGDIAEVRIYNGQLTTAEVASVYAEVNGFYNDLPPVGVADTYTLPEDASFFQSLINANQGVLANDQDPEGMPLTAVLLETTTHGILNFNPDGSFIYDSDANFFGTDQFVYAPVDFRAGDPVTVTINVTPVYDKPTAVPEEYKLLSGTVLNVAASEGLLANDINPDQAALTAVVSRPVTNGLLTLNADGSFAYDPQGFAGRTSFAYRIQDGTGQSDPGEVTLIVNSPPEARDDTFTLNEDTPFSRTAANGVFANDFDAEGDTLVATLIDGQGPLHGSLTFQSDGSFTYVPEPNYFGTDSFQYQTTDGEDSSNIATVRLTIRAVNDAPSPQADTYFTREGQTLQVTRQAGVLQNDTDIEGDALTAQLVAAPQNGTVTLAADGSFLYQPPAGFTGVDRFTYRANDGQLNSEPAEVLIAINSLEQQQQVVINEVHADPDIKTELVEFIELHNRGTVPVNLTGWRLQEAVDYVFPEGVAIEPGGYVVVTENPELFAAKFGREALGPWNGKLSNDGEDIELWTPAGDRIDRVDYQLGFPWPTYGETPGPSMQLIHPDFENDLGGNWRGAVPTPGEINSVYALNAAPQMRRIEHSPEQPGSNQPVTITTTVSDPNGVQSVVLQYQLVNPGDYFSLDDPRYASEWTSVPMLDNGQSGDGDAGDGVFGAILPASVQMHRRLVRYRVTSTDTLGSSRTAPYEDDPVPNFAYFVYDGVPDWTGAARPGDTPAVTYSSDLLSSIPVYHLITTHESHVDSQFIPDSQQRSGYGGNDYRWSGTMVYDGVVYDHIGYRARGGVWRYAMGKNMWKFDFHRSDRFQARDNYGEEYNTKWDKLNFSAIIQQGDYLHRGEQGLFESVGFELFNLAGTESPNTHYVHFRIVSDANEQGDDQFGTDFQGLYLAVEQPDSNFLEEHDLPDGNFYKIENYAPESTVNQGATQVDDASDVRDFIRAFRRQPGVDFWVENLDLERYYGYQAISQAIHHYDTAFGKNYYYFHNPETGKWQIHPWDLDLTWADNMFGNENHEFNVQVARYPEFNNYTNQANIDLRNRYNADYQNHVREILDLLYNPEQTGMLIDQFAAIVYQPGQPSLVDADRAMWDANPINSQNSRYTNSSKNNTNPRHRFYERSSTKDFPGMIQLMKDYVESRSRWIDRVILTNEENIPQTPTVTYAGPAGFPMDQLTFSTTAFSSPIGAEFAGMEWRIAEVTDPNAPGFNAYDRSGPRTYEINAQWESGELAEFESSTGIPAHVLEAGKTYRVRVRMKDNDNHWSHWSEPVQFVASAAIDTNVAESLRVSELHYHPADPSSAELAAGFTDADDFEFIELINRGSQTIDLRGVTLDRLVVEGEEEGVAFAFAEGAITELAPGGRVVVVENLEAFTARYGSSLPVAGEWSGGLRNSGEMITLSAFGAIVQQFTYDDAWHTATDGEGPSLVVVDVNQPDLNVWNLASGWQPSDQAGGSPGTDGSTRVPGDSNNDGRFDSSDLVQIFQRGQYEDAIPGNSTWEDGDWNGDGDFTTSDLVFAFTAGTYQAAASPVADLRLVAAALDRVWESW